MHTYNTRHSTYAVAISASTAPTVTEPTPVIADSPPAPTVAPTTPANDATPPVAIGAPPPPTTLNAVIANAIDDINAHTAETPAQLPASVVQDQHNPTVNCYFAPGVVEDQVPPVPVVSPHSDASPAPPSTPTPPTIATVNEDIVDAFADDDDEAVINQ